MAMKLRTVNFLLRNRLLLSERPVTAGGTASGRCGAQVCQLWLQTKQSCFTFKHPSGEKS